MKPTDAIPHPSHWRTEIVGEVVDIKRGLSWSKNQELEGSQPGAWPVLRIGNVQFRLELDALLYLIGVHPRHADQKKVSQDWCIMVGSNGNRKRIGNAVLIREDTDYLFASFLIAVRPKEGTDIRPAYFFRWLQSERVQAYLSASSEGTTGLNNLSHSFFRSMTLPVPPDDEQIEIIEAMDSLDSVIDKALDSVLTAKHLVHSVFDDLLAGSTGKVLRTVGEPK